MARSKAPCGTYPAYKRHLRDETPVDAACRRAQREHDTGRGLAWKAEDLAPTPVVVVPAPTLASLEQRRDEMQARFAQVIPAMSVAADAGELYAVIDAEHELDQVLDLWCEAADAVEHSRKASRDNGAVSK